MRGRPRLGRGGDASWNTPGRLPGSETWFPKFFYQGCRYLQVECTAPSVAASLPIVESLVACGELLVGAGRRVLLLERLFNASTRSCAGRSAAYGERADRLPAPRKARLAEETHLNGPALRYEFDLARLLAKSTDDMADAHSPTASCPTSPGVRQFAGGFRDSPDGAAPAYSSLAQYEWTGDLELFGAITT